MKKDWIEVELKTIGEIVTGGTPSKNDFSNYSSNDFPFYKPTDLNQGILTIESNDFLSSKAYASARKAPKNSVLVTCIGATIGKTGFIKREGSFNQQINAIIPNGSIESKFLYYQIISQDFQNKIVHSSSSTTLPILNKSKFSILPINVAPLPEQRAIVARIEELFSELDHSIANLKSAQAKLEIYRQAVLKKAFEIPDCKFIKLVKITSKIGSGSTPRGGRENYKTEGIPLVRSLNIHFNFIKFKDLAFIDQEQARKLDNVIIEKDDVLLNITGASIGRVNIAPKEFEGGRVNQHVSIIRPTSGYLSIFIKYFLESPLVQGIINSENYGVTRQALTKSMIENFGIPDLLPSQQMQVVQEIESRFSVADKLAETIQTNLLKSESLRQSILKKAFEGKLLTEAELEACRKEADWEPAERLLERIKGGKKK